MDPATAAGIGIGGSVGLLGILKCLKKALGFKSCKYYSNSNNDECVFGCKATKKVRNENLSKQSIRNLEAKIDAQPDIDEKNDDI